MNSYGKFQNRMEEVQCIIDLIPEKPKSDNISTIDALTRASIVLLSSHLEGFLQDIMEEFIEGLNELEISFSKLPVELYVQNEFPKGKFYDNRKEMIKFIENVKLLQKIDPEISLNKNNFNKTESNPTSDIINKLFNIIGVENVIDELNIKIKKLSDKKKYKNFFTDDEKKELEEQYGCIIDGIDKYIVKKRNMVNKKSRAIGFYNTINRLLDYRNNIAHGNFNMRISIQELIEIKDEIEELVRGLSDIADEKLNEFKVEYCQTE